MEWHTLALLTVGALLPYSLSPYFFGLTASGLAISTIMALSGSNLFLIVVTILTFIIAGVCVMLTKRAIISEKNKIFMESLIGKEGTAIMRLERLKSGIIKLDRPILGDYEWLAHSVNGDIYPGQRVAIVSQYENVLFVDSIE